MIKSVVKPPQDLANKNYAYGEKITARRWFFKIDGSTILGVFVDHLNLKIFTRTLKFIDGNWHYLNDYHTFEHISPVKIEHMSPVVHNASVLHIVYSVNDSTNITVVRYKLQNYKEEKGKNPSFENDILASTMNPLGKDDVFITKYVECFPISVGDKLETTECLLDTSDPIIKSIKIELQSDAKKPEDLLKSKEGSQELYKLFKPA